MTNPFRGSSTDDTRIQVNWVELTGDATGGAQILSYNLEMEKNGVMTELVGQSSYYSGISYTEQTGIVSGQNYKFRLRARNKWGFGLWSDTIIIPASTNPLTQVTSPTTSNNGAIVLIQWPLPDQKGSAIIEYQVMILTSDGLNFEEEPVNCDGA